MGVTRITHQAVIRLGLTQSVTEAYLGRLKLSGEPGFELRAEGVKTLECVRSRNEQKDARVLQPDVIIGCRAAVRDERMGNPGTDSPGGNRTRHQVALEDEPERQFPGIPEPGAGPDEEAVHHHPRSRGEDRGAV